MKLLKVLTVQVCSERLHCLLLSPKSHQDLVSSNPPADDGRQLAVDLELIQGGLVPLLFDVSEAESEQSCLLIRQNVRMKTSHVPLQPRVLVFQTLQHCLGHVLVPKLDFK